MELSCFHHSKRIEIDLFFDRIEKINILQKIKILTVVKAFSHFNNIDKTIEKRHLIFIVFILKNMFIRFMICPVND